MGCGSSSNTVENQPDRNSETADTRSTRSSATRANPDTNYSPSSLAGSRPLALPSTTFKSSKPLSGDALSKERAEFWATRVTGIPDIWNYLKMACEALIEGEAETANAIIVAANIRTPRGNLAICFDERGGEYVVPEYCYSTPVAGPKGSTKAAVSSPATKSGPSSPLVIRMRVAGYQKDFTIGDTTIDGGVELNDMNTVAELKKLLSGLISGPMGKESGGPSAGEALPVDRMRLIFSGRPLNNDKQTIRALGIKDKAVVQVFPRPAPK
mmetsp:Transcript_12016/g.15484  ORF Transcript_12016/g.15484 Transcript_12016/m.15484 type:complete len:269 (-) Transcript_12016:205-1011(-)